MIVRDQRSAGARRLDQLDQDPDGALARLLDPLGRAYAGLAALKRRWQPDHPLPSPPASIGVGNLRVGGTGKTPVVVDIGRRLLESGRRVAVASRGYRAEGGGDEPELLRAAGLAVHLGSDRRVAHREAQKSGVDVLLLDDALQTRHRPGHCLAIVLERDLLRMPRTLPAGPAREGQVGLERADALIVRREGSVGPVLAPNWRGRTMVGVRLSPRAWICAGAVEASPVEASLDQPPFESPVVAVSGLARPASFEADLQAIGVTLAGTWRGEDHWSPSADEIAELERWALEIGAKTLVCPEKNLQRLRTRVQRLPLVALSSSIRWECEDPLVETGIASYLERVFRTSKEGDG